MPDERQRWSDERIDDFVRVVGPVAGMMANATADIDVLQASLRSHEKLVSDGFHRLERDTREDFDRIFKVLERIETHVEKTNGRVTALELNRATEEAVRLATAAAVEERRSRIAMRLAKNGWVAPTMAGGIIALLVSYAPKLLG